VSETGPAAKAAARHGIRICDHLPPTIQKGLSPRPESEEEEDGDVQDEIAHHDESFAGTDDYIFNKEMTSEQLVARAKQQR